MVRKRTPQWQKDAESGKYAKNNAHVRFQIVASDFL
jgi:DNA-directed RNA polymerase subunit E'/Rpb7